MAGLPTRNHALRMCRACSVPRICATLPDEAVAFTATAPSGTSTPTTAGQTLHPYTCDCATHLEPFTHEPRLDPTVGGRARARKAQFPVCCCENHQPNWAALAGWQAASLMPWQGGARTAIPRLHSTAEPSCCAFHVRTGDTTVIGSNLHRAPLDPLSFSTRPLPGKAPVPFDVLQRWPQREKN